MQAAGARHVNRQAAACWPFALTLFSLISAQGNITFATIDLAVTLGYPLKHFLKLNMRQILPPPINAMHEKWLRVRVPGLLALMGRALLLLSWGVTSSSDGA